MVSHEFSGIIQAIQDDFQYFLDPAALEYRTTHIENIYYHFSYNHFFPIIGHEFQGEVHVAGTIIPNYLDYLPIVKEIQERRIERLIELLSSQEKIIFIRSHATPDEASTFVHKVKDKYPQLNFILVIVHERQDLIGDWKIPYVMNFYANQRCGFADWWTSTEWFNILYTLLVMTS